MIFLIFVQHMKHWMWIRKYVVNMIWWQTPWSLCNKWLHHSQNSEANSSVCKKYPLQSTYLIICLKVKAIDENVHLLLLTPLRPNSCSSDSKTNSLKYRTLHLRPSTLLEILASSLTNILPSLTKLHISPKPTTITFVNFAAYAHTFIRQLPVPLLPRSFTLNLTTVILSIINSLSLNYPVSSRSRNLLLVLSLKLLRPAKSLISYALFTGSESMNASNTSSSLLPTKFSHITNLRTFITSSLFNVLAVLALHRRYSCSATYIILS